MTNPRLSIITPALNHAHFLPQAIRSVRTSANWTLEHLVIDRGSTDCSADVAQAHGVTSVHTLAGGLGWAAAVNAKPEARLSAG